MRRSSDENRRLAGVAPQGRITDTLAWPADLLARLDAAFQPSPFDPTEDAA